MRFLFLSRFCLFVSIGLGSAAYSYGSNLSAREVKPTSHVRSLRDTIDADSASDSLFVISDPEKKGLQVLSLDPAKLSTFPALSLQQMLKGQAAGLYVQEPNGEPGTVQNMFIHGTSVPLLSERELYRTQPLVVLDGIPLNATDHPMALDIQQYKFNRIGPATNLLSIISMDNIESVEVLKDISAISVYGPRAANGVIVIKTKKAGSARKISFDSYIGMAQNHSITTVNGQFENTFRKQFYDKYTPNGLYSENDAFPLYLSDSLNNNYYGPANWNDNYYRNGVVYSVNAGIAGGTDRANFRFNVGSLKQDGVADNTSSQRYGTRFNINMKPMEWLIFSATVNANRVDRDRNRNLRDRFSQVNYLPDLSSPLSPNKESYSKYLAEFNKGFDNNKSNIIQGSARVGIDLGEFKFASTLGLDYSEGFRDIFYPRTLLQTTNYASNYFGYNQRLMWDNTATYDLKLEGGHDFQFEVGSSLQYDTHKYNYAYAYKGTNDFIKLNLLHSDPNRGDYLEPFVFERFLVYKFLDKTKNNLVSFSGKAVYDFNEKYTISALLRADGSSNAQPTSRWFYSPTLFASWNIKKDLLDDAQGISDLKLRASVGRLGRYEPFDNYGQGPQYTAFVGFTGNLIAPGYNGFASLTRPYSSGFVGYNLEWAYTDQVNAGVDIALFNNRVRASLDVYSREDKNQVLGIPSAAEFGYVSVYKNGMNVSNQGIDVNLSADVFPVGKSELSWTTALNFNFNKNKLKAIPGGLSSLVIGNRLLRVGEAVDSYWVLQNEGIFNSDSEVPVKDGKPMSYKGIALKAGDAKWNDVNGDNIINDDDKVLKGHALPILAGGFNNDFAYKKWNLSLNFYYNLGRDLINQEMANRFDFISREGLNNINSVKEITFWEKRGEYTNYPIYNPWSSSTPYQVDQDLFLENASFLKLRTISLGYDLTNSIKAKGIGRFYVYGSVNNVFTLTKYTGQDPELVDFTGYDTGYGIQIPRTYSLGVKMEF